jgi:beta-mannosidase
MGVNEREVQWVNESEWWYRKEVELTPEIVNKDVIELAFESLDTFATIWVNDIKVGEADNMFTPWRFSIKQAAKAGKNLIVIRFKPVNKVAAELEKQHQHKYVSLSADNFSARPYVRKAQYSFGWDWGPTLPTSGIWRKAKVVAFNTGRLGYLAGLPEEVSEEKAKVKLSVEVYAAKETTLNVKFSLEGFGQKKEGRCELKTKIGRNFADCILEVESPKLWWPRGYGEPNLYVVTAQVFNNEELLDKGTVKVGIRSIKLIQEPDEEGKTFIFQINGLNVFCKGANWIPADSFLPKVNYERYYKLLDYAADANFNMLRVWGGGVYEADEFYDLCDSLGIMVWQDFMYVCAGYPEEEWFLKEAEREAMEAVLRLRGHPSIVLWCGNNENQWLHSVLWRVRDKVERLYGSQIYESLLRRVCQFLDPTRPYRPSTPFGGEDSSGRHEGDRHNWEVWSQGIDYPAYLQDNGRFISEFGWQAPPTMKLLSAYIEKQDLTPDSFAFRAHEKQIGGLELLKALLSIHYPLAANMDQFVLYGQLNQGEALKTAVTHWRSRMFKTSGCLVWQLNDCWPVISWALIDYGLNPKAAYYYVKRACQPVIAPLIVKDDKVEVYIINETATPLDASLKLEVITFSGEVLFDEIVKKPVPAYTSALAMQKELDDLPLKSNCLIVSTLESGEKVLSVDVRTATEPKNLKLPPPQIEVAISRIDEKTFEATCESPVYAKAVKLDLGDKKAKLSDNFFDLLPSRKKTVNIHLDAPIGIEQFEKALIWESYPYKELSK